MKYIKIISSFVLTIVVLIIAIIVDAPTFHFYMQNEPLHSTIEATGAITALFVSIMLFQSRSRLDFNAIALVFGFFAMGLFDIIHSVTMPGQLFVFSHTLANLVGGIGFFANLIINFGVKKFEPKKRTFWLILLAITALGACMIAFKDLQPAMMDNGEFTLGSKIIHFFAGVFYLSGAVYFLIHYHKNNDRLSYLLLTVALLFGTSSFTFFLSEIWCTSWWLWHFAKALAYIFVIAFILVNNNENTIHITKMNLEIKDINKKLNNYTYTISHDLKEPIRSIRTFSEFILEDYADSFDETSKDYFGRIIRASEKMAGMIDDLLILSRVGRVDIKFEDTDINVLLKDIEENLSTLIFEAKAQIKYKNLPMVHCQPLWIKMLFSNLISNSIKYRNPERDGVKIEISYRDDDAFHEFSITDNGKGIEKEQFEKVFGLFRKAHVDRNIEGSGAGLAIVSAIVEQHGGKVWISRSELGKGTTVTFNINKKGERLW